VRRVAKQYRVVFLGTMNDDETFRNNMARLGVSYTDVNKCIENAPVVLKRDLRLADARRYADAIIDAGGLINIQETGEIPEARFPAEKRISSPPQDFVLCPNCGFKQKKEDFCVRCGFGLSPSV
jgi:hypothetical protein